MGEGGGEESARFIPQNRKTKATQSAPRETEREREGEKMSNAGRLVNRRPGRERASEAEESGSEREREWQRMYLSRSQIINRDAVVWIDGGGGRGWGRG